MVINPKKSYFYTFQCWTNFKVISAMILFIAVLRSEGGGTRIEEERATLESSTVASGRRDTVILVAFVAVADVTAIPLPPLGVVILLPVILVISARGCDNSTSSLTVRNLKLVINI